MRKITLLLILSFVFTATFSQLATRSGERNELQSAIKNYLVDNKKAAIFAENFESGNLDGWGNLDEDGDEDFWGVFEGADQAHSGNFFAVSASWSSIAGALTPENWLITPAIDLTAESGSVYVDYFVGPQDQAWPSEHYKLVVSTAGNAVEDFTTILIEETIVVGDENGYTKKTIDLSAYAGETIYLAWVHFDCTDWFRLMLDDVKVYNDQPASSEAEILDFMADGGVGDAEIDSENATVAYMVLPGTDLTDLSTEITVSVGAQVTGTTTNDYTDPVTIMVEAEDLTIKNWTVTVSELVATEASIYEIQYTDDESGDSPLVDEIVKTTGIVTAVDDNGFFLQDSASAWNGIWAYAPDAEGIVAGDEVTVMGFVKEFFNLTEIEVIDGDVLSQGNDLPAAVVIPVTDFGEAYEGVLVTVETVTAKDTANQYGEWVVMDEALNEMVVDDMLYAYSPEAGEEFLSVTGCTHFSFGDFKLLPRIETDIVPVSITQEALEAINMFPNPVNDVLYFNNLEGVSQVVISNVIGQAVIVKNIVENGMTINTSELNAGIYIVTLVTEDNLVRSERIVKE